MKNKEATSLYPVAEVMQLQAANRAALDMVEVYESRLRQVEEAWATARSNEYEARAALSDKNRRIRELELALENVLRGKARKAWWRFF